MLTLLAMVLPCGGAAGAAVQQQQLYFTSTPPSVCSDSQPSPRQQRPAEIYESYMRRLRKAQPIYTDDAAGKLGSAMLP